MSVDWLTIADVCRELRITRTTYVRRVRPSIRQTVIGRQVRIRREDLNAWLNERAKEGVRDAG